jgi:hypothetical protein
MGYELRPTSRKAGAFNIGKFDIWNVHASVRSLKPKPVDLTYLQPSSTTSNTSFVSAGSSNGNRNKQNTIVVIDCDDSSTSNNNNNSNSNSSSLSRAKRPVELISLIDDPPATSNKRSTSATIVNLDDDD